MVRFRGLVRIGLIVIGVLAVAPATSWGRPTAGQRYMVTLKLSGHYSFQISGYDCCGYNQNVVADWHYQQRFGPVELFSGGTHNAKAHTPSASGTWTETMTDQPPNPSCSRSGNFSGAGIGPSALKVAPGFDGGDSVILHGDALQQVLPVEDNCGYLIFDGCNQTVSISHARTGSCTAQNVYNYFPVDLSVTKPGLRARNGTYHVSSAKNPGEHVDPHCKIQQNPSIGYTSACAYTWSGTVSFKPA